MDGHVKLESLQQLGEVLDIDIRPNPLLLDIVAITLDVDEKGQTWEISQCLFREAVDWVKLCAPLGLRFISYAGILLDVCL